MLHTADPAELSCAHQAKVTDEGLADNTKEAMQAHCTVIMALQRSPFLDDTILTVGDWTFALWRESRPDLPLIQSPPSPAPYTAGCFSPTRAGGYAVFHVVLCISACTFLELAQTRADAGAHCLAV